MSKYLRTIDLAKALNLSPSTVSRALNDHYSISAETKKRVADYAKKVGYQKNINAARLIGQKTFTIGVLLPEITSYFFSTVTRGIREALEPAGYDMIIVQSSERFTREVHNIEYLSSIRVDGIIFSPTLETQSFGHLDIIMKNKIPFVNIDRGLPGFNCHQVLSDDEFGAYQAVQHLIDVGCKKIAHIAGPANASNSNNRVKGYKRALQANNIPVDESLITRSDFRISNSMQTVRDIFDRKELPDGIFAVNDEMALGCLYVARQKGIRIPEQLAVVGFDDEIYCQYHNPSLSTVRNPIYEMGKTAAQLCLDQIDDPEYSPEKFQTRIFKPELIIRASSKRGNIRHYV